LICKSIKIRNEKISYQSHLQKKKKIERVQLVMIGEVIKKKFKKK